MHARVHKEAPQSFKHTEMAASILCLSAFSKPPPPSLPSRDLSTKPSIPPVPVCSWIFYFTSLLSSPVPAPQHVGYLPSRANPEFVFYTCPPHRWTNSKLTRSMLHKYLAATTPLYLCLILPTASESLLPIERIGSTFHVRSTSYYGRAVP